MLIQVFRLDQAEQFHSYCSGFTFKYVHFLKKNVDEPYLCSVFITTKTNIPTDIRGWQNPD